MRLEDVPLAALPDLIEDLSDLRHDLGKYILFEVRFLGPTTDTEALRSALLADIEQTHKRGDDVSAAWEVWQRLRPDMLAGDEDVERIETSLEALRQLDLSGPMAVLQEASRLAGEVANATRALHRRALALE